MLRQHIAAFANFVCRFGDDKVLLDYAEDIVIPAFVDNSLVRTYGRTHFFFYEAKLVILDEDRAKPVLGITGRFIKNTQLTREQIFDPRRGLVHDEASMPSAPSAHFVLVLNSHRLIYFPETAHAPDLNTFQSTALAFLRQKHKSFIDRMYDEARERDEKVTKKELVAANPHPTLEVIPISGDDEIEAFVKRYGVLRRIEFRLVTPNDEIDGEELFKDIREYFGPLNPDATKIETRNSDGLNVDAAVPRIKAATATANQQVKLSGLDHDGNKLSGDNHSFQVGAPVETIPATGAGLTKVLYEIFENLRGQGTIKISAQSQSVADKIRHLLSLF